MDQSVSVTRTPAKSGVALHQQHCGIAWHDDVDCRLCEMRQQTLFAALHDTDFDDILLPVHRAIVPSGTPLYQENATADALYTVRWGLVKLFKQISHGEYRIVRLLGRGATIGLEGLEEGVYWHSATTLQESGLCRIPFQVIDRLRIHNGKLMERLTQQWECHLRYADRWITELSTGSIRARLHHLIDLLIEISSNRSHEIEIPPVHDLAAVLGVSSESVSRAMAELKRSGALQRIAPRTYRYAAGDPAGGDRRLDP
jgi:CRP-like cAMP-binding protein